MKPRSQSAADQRAAPAALPRLLQADAECSLLIDDSYDDLTEIHYIVRDLVPAMEA